MRRSSVENSCCWLIIHYNKFFGLAAENNHLSELVHMGFVHHAPCPSIFQTPRKMAADSTPRKSKTVSNSAIIKIDEQTNRNPSLPWSKPWWLVCMAMSIPSHDAMMPGWPYDASHGTSQKNAMALARVHNRLCCVSRNDNG